ncbi:MAG: radical SAM protein, partial [Vicinamibacterales bacterium]
MAGLYVHVPFCAAICEYCNFTRGLLDEAVKRRYVTALVADIRRHAGDHAIESVYFGGGTPSLLTPDEVGAIVGAIRTSFRLADDAEISLEANPESVTAAGAAGYLAAGVNRVSLGVQSFRDDELARLGRLHSAARAVAAVGELRSAGVANLSLDLMLWLPEQTRSHLRESIGRLIDVGPEHASVYLLEVYPN